MHVRQCQRLPGRHRAADACCAALQGLACHCIRVRQSHPTIAHLGAPLAHTARGKVRGGPGTHRQQAQQTQKAGAPAPQASKHPCQQLYSAGCSRGAGRDMHVVGPLTAGQSTGQTWCRGPGRSRSCNRRRAPRVSVRQWLGLSSAWLAAPTLVSVGHSTKSDHLVGSEHDRVPLHGLKPALLVCPATGHDTCPARLPCPPHPLATSAWKTAAQAGHQGRQRWRSQHHSSRSLCRQVQRARQQAAADAGVAWPACAEPSTGGCPRPAGHSATNSRVLPTRGRPRCEHLLLTAFTLPSTAASRMR